MIDDIFVVSKWITKAIQDGRKIILFGNGGSASDAQHIAAEFVGRFERERCAWPAIALTTDSSILTALGNDYGIQKIFSRQIEALGKPGDVAIAISTSGNSPNVIAGVKTAQEKDIRVIGITGEDGGKLSTMCDLVLRVPSNRTARIQESHITILHAICEVVEVALK